jgi:RNA polymerase sigma-70 factor (sigma-E family)
MLCGDPHLAEDIVQDTLARLYANWPRVVRADNVEGYVRRMLVNSHYSDRRRPWRRESSSVASQDLSFEPGLAPEDADAIWAAIRRLPPGQRKVVVLRYLWDRSVEDTAADLGISTGTVKSQASDALAALRRALTSDFGTTSLQGEER